MSSQEKATELMDKFGSKSLEVLEETLWVWDYKKTLRTKEMGNSKYNKNKYENAKRGFEISVRTLKYWNSVKDIILKLN